MSQRFFRLLILITIALALPLCVWLVMPQPQAAAQCGTKASSCKTCHEIQGKQRVNTRGDWHVQHAFGDFCVFCHAGDAKVKDKAKAHKGLVKPLADVSASCAMCHEADCNTRAENYAKVLGVTVGMGSGGPTAPRGPAPLLPFVPRVAGVGEQTTLPGQDQSPIAESSPPSSDDEEPRNINWGNVALAALALALLFGGGGFAFLTGAGLYAATWKDVFPKISQIANLGNTILPELWNLSSVLMALVFVEFTLFLFYLLERKIGQRVDKMAVDK